MKNLTFVKETTAVTQTPSDAYGTTTLAAGTYYAELDVDKVSRKGLLSIQHILGSALDATITVEATNCLEAKVYDATSGLKWIDIAAIPDVIAAHTAASSIGSWADVGYGRMRVKVVVTTQGTLRSIFNYKDQ